MQTSSPTRNAAEPQSPPRSVEASTPPVPSYRCEENDGPFPLAADARPYIDPRRIARLQGNDEWLEAIEQRLVETRHIDIEEDFLIQVRDVVIAIGLAVFLLGCVAVLLP